MAKVLDFTKQKKFFPKIPPPVVSCTKSKEVRSGSDTIWKAWVDKISWVLNTREKNILTK